MKNPVISMWHIMWRYSKGYRKSVVLFIVLESVSTIGYMFDPYIVGRAFNYVQQSEVYDRRVFDVLLGHFLFILLLVLIRWVFWGTGRVLEHSTAFHIKNVYKLEMLKIVLHLPMEWHQENHSGKTIDKIRRASDALEEYAGGISQLVDAFWKLVVGFIALLLINWFAGGFAMIVSLFAIMIIIRVDRHIATLLTKIFCFKNKTASSIHDYVSNATTVISLKLQDNAFKDVYKRMYKPFAIFRRKLIIDEWKWAGVDISITAMITIVIGVYAFFVLQRGEILLIGTLTMIYSYLAKISDVFFMTAWRFGQIVEQDAKVRAANTILKSQNKMISTENLKKMPWNVIELKNVFFSYKKKAKRRKTGIFGLNLELKKGQNIAFVGMSGGGKSTAMSLLKGFYSPERGRIFFDGKVPKEGFEQLHDTVAYIPQHPEIFQNTVKYNVALNGAATKKEIDEVLRLSNFDEVLGRLKATTSLNVAEKGVTLSGGEKQRLALARGLFFAKDKDIICLDEPTSSVDAKGELKIFKSIFRKFNNKTIIASVHRFHLLALFDYIYVFKDGKVVGGGTLKTLKNENKEFKHLLRAYKEAEEDDLLEVAE